jgi:hypothetical protein
VIRRDPRGQDRRDLRDVTERQNDENHRVFALDGVPTALELEVGTADVPLF